MIMLLFSTFFGFYIAFATQMLYCVYYLTFLSILNYCTKYYND